MEENKAVMPLGASNDEEMEIDLIELFFYLLRRWYIIALAMILTAGIAVAYHMFLLKPSYQADAELYITNTDSLLSLSDLQLSAALTEDYSNIVVSRTVLNDVIDELGLDLDYRGLKSIINVENPKSTHIIKLFATCDSPEMAKNIVNALLNASASQIYKIVGSGEPSIIDFATDESVVETTPGRMKFLALGALIGMVLSCGVLVIQMLMDTTIKGEEDIEKYLNLPVLAAVPYYRIKD